MKITDVTVTAVDMGPLETPFWNSIIKTTRRGAGRIEIATDGGVVGMAPCSTSAAHRATLLGPMKQKLLGEDPLRIGYLWDKLYMGGTRKPVAKGEYIAAMSAVDNALWDLVGKALGQPVWKLAGGVQSRV